MSFWKRALRPLALALRYARHAAYPRASYAAHAEDVAAELLVGPVRRFIDVGANDGFTGSNCLRFALRGARGLCFEPDPENYARLTGLLRFNRRVECIPEALSAAPGELDLRCEGVLSTLVGNEDPSLDALLAGHRSGPTQTVRVKLATLAQHLARHPGFVPAEVLSIDVEGHELAVLQGIDWQATPVPAQLLILETHAHGESGEWRHRDLAAILALLAERGYQPVAESRNNTLWLHASARRAERLTAARAQLADYRWKDA